MKKHILCYGDSNTWGYIPGTIDIMTGYKERYQQRWTRLLQQLLGEEYHVLEEGLGSRTTNIDDPDRPGRNGLSFLKVCLESHAPLSLVVLMLGTNDLNIKYKRTEPDILNGLQELINCIKATNCGTDMLSPPKILIIFPPHPSHEKGFNGQFEGSIALSQKLPNLYQKLAHDNNCYFINAADLIELSDIDGIHLDANGHRQLSELIKNKIEQIKVL